MIGATVDQYKIIKALENKIIYEVFLAQHIQTGSSFELHAISPNITMQGSYKEALKNETAGLIALEHPTIIAPLNLLEVEDRLYIVYPYEEAKSLKELYSGNTGQFPIDGLMRIFKDILRGIGYAHSEGYHHFALNLDAIVVNDDGDAKLRGFSKILFHALEEYIGKDDMLSYARYYSPERFNNPNTEDIRSNIFTLGAILYQMATNQPAIEGETVFRIEMAQADPDHRVIPADTLREDLPAGFSEMLTKALEKKPEKRFQNPIEFYQEIEKIESKKRSALFDNDFVKGFGSLDGDTLSNSEDLSSSSSSSFKIEDPFNQNSDFDLGFDFSREDADKQNQASQFDLDKTVKDSSFDPQLLSKGLIDPKPEMKLDSDPFSGDEPSGSVFGGGEDPFAALQSELSPADSEPASDFQQAENPFDSPVDANSDPFAFNMDSGPEPESLGGEQPQMPSFDFDMPSESDQPRPGIELTSSPHGADEMIIERNEAPLQPANSHFESDDGSFQFTAVPDTLSSDGMGFNDPIELNIPKEPEMPPMPSDDDMAAMPSVRRVEQKLQSSLKAANRPRMIGARAVRKKSKLAPVLSALALLAVIALAWFFYNQHTKNKEFDKIRTRIKAHIEERSMKSLNQGKDLVVQALRGSFSSRQIADLEGFQAVIDRALLNNAEEIEGLFDKAREYERQGKRLVDGEMDAFGRYLKIREIDPENQQAEQNMFRIRDLENNQVKKLIEEGDSIVALKKLRVLRNNFANPEIDEEYRVLLNILKQTKGTALESELLKQYKQKKYDALPAIVQQLRMIDPGTEFLKTNLPNMVEKMVKIGESYQEKQRFEKAESVYKAASALAPEDKKIKQKINSVKESANMVRVERAQSRLSDALAGTDLRKQKDAYTALQEIDPGNPMASSAEIAVQEKIDLLRAEADRIRVLGRFKEASEKYQQLYKITGSKDVKKLWLKYKSWTPPAGMVYIPGGRFKIGYNPDRKSRPAHYVTLSPYYVDKFEVTNGDFKAFVDANPQWAPGKISSDLHDANYLKHWKNGAPAPGTQYLPVTNISYYAAKAYARSKGKRLLTEAEWEVAAAGGTTNQKFWWGNSSSATKAVYNKYAKRSPAAVGSFPVNEYGIFEILGNVSEWVQDTYDEDFYKKSQNKKDPVSKAGHIHIHRGGSYKHLGREITVYQRFPEDPRRCAPYIGFRLAKDARN